MVYLSWNLKFVKDKNNLWPHAFYFAGDYLPLPENQLINSKVTIQSSNDWSSNGESSLKLTSNSTGGYLRFKYDISGNDIGKTCVLGINVFSNVIGNVYLNGFDNNNSVLLNKQVQYPANTGTMTSFSEVILENISYITLTVNFVQDANAIRYVDGLFLNIL